MATVSVSWDQVFAWRLRRQYLEPRTDLSVVEIVRRLCGVQAQVSSSAVQAVLARQAGSPRRAGLGSSVKPAPQGKPVVGGVEAALESRELLKTWSMRGTLHLLPPDIAGAFGCLIAAARTWERPAWVRAYGLTPDEVSDLGERVAEALHGRTLSREELIDAIVVKASYAEHIRSGWGTALKPLAWQGLLCHGPSRGNRITFTTPASWAPSFRPYADQDAAAAVAIPAYLGAYGPATPKSFGNWLSRSASSRASLRRWFAALGDRVVPVDVEGRQAFHLAEYLDDLVSCRPSRAVRLLPGFDQYLLGPGTDDPAVLAPERRTTVSRAAGWIAPIVVSRGRVAGVWSGGSGTPVEVTSFDPIDGRALATEVRRVS